MISASKKMSKSIAERSNRLSVFWLKKKNYLKKGCVYQSGNITWSYGDYDTNKISINFSINLDINNNLKEINYMNLNYIDTNRYSGEENSMNYDIQLVTTPCRYGGKRYWFICPLSKNGICCGRRVGVIFKIGKWFGCRHCGNIAYSKQMAGGKYRWNGVTIPDVQRAEKDFKRCYYGGKPTRKYKRYTKLYNKFMGGWETLLAKYENELPNNKKK